MANINEQGGKNWYFGKTSKEKEQRVAGDVRR